MTGSSEDPKRIAQPEEVKYILLDKKTFVELVANFQAVIEQQTSQKQEVSIDVAGFDGAFSSAQRLTEKLTLQEWLALDEIRVRFRDAKSDSYMHRLALNFGGYAFIGAGLRIDYSSSNTDIERLSIKEKIDVFMSDYTRRVLPDDRFLSLGLGVVAFCGLTLWIYALLSSDFMSKLSLWNHINIGAGLGAVAFGVYAVTSFIHHKLVPHFETVQQLGKTRLKRSGKLIGIVVIIIGLVSSVMAIWQAIPHS